MEAPLCTGLTRHSGRRICLRYATANPRLSFGVSALMATIITKLEAAERQLNTAIRLFFDGGDVVSVHSLAVAAANVFADVAERNGSGQSWRTRMQDDTGMPMKDLKALMHEEWNFFKHADRDPDAKLSFDELLSDGFIFMATVGCGDLKPTSYLMQAFQIWYIAAYPKSFPADEPLFEDAKNLLSGLAEQSRAKQLQRGAAFIEEYRAYVSH